MFVDDERGESHKGRRCHVLWPDGSAAVDFKSAELLVGSELPRRARELIERDAALIEETWLCLNGEE